LSQPDEVVHPLVPLAIVLEDMEKKKGRALTAEEVLAARDELPCIVMLAEHRDELEQDRGFRDIDPVNAWKEWQEYRMTIPGNEN
jgi:hypothetical protein